MTSGTSRWLKTMSEVFNKIRQHVRRADDDSRRWYMGPVKLRNVEEAQQKFVSIIRRLEDSGEIAINRGGAGGNDEIVV